MIFYSWKSLKGFNETIYTAAAALQKGTVGWKLEIMVSGGKTKRQTYDQLTDSFNLGAIYQRDSYDLQAKVLGNLLKEALVLNKQYRP